jgi:hypothetical protein
MTLLLLYSAAKATFVILVEVFGHLLWGGAVSQGSHYQRQLLFLRYMPPPCMEEEAFLELCNDTLRCYNADLRYRWSIS